MIQTRCLLLLFFQMMIVVCFVFFVVAVICESRCFFSCSIISLMTNQFNLYLWKKNKRFFQFNELKEFAGSWNRKIVFFSPFCFSVILTLFIVVFVVVVVVVNVVLFFWPFLFLYSCVSTTTTTNIETLETQVLFIYFFYFIPQKKIIKSFSHYISRFYSFSFSFHWLFSMFFCLLHHRGSILQ